MQTDTGLDVVTGALSYSGKYITTRLLASGRRVRTITGHPGHRNPFGEAVDIIPMRFDDPLELRRSLEGATTLYNTYWVRFPYRGVGYRDAVRNSKTLFMAAEEAGVRRVVHVSITGASEDSPFPYFRGKARVEKALQSSGMSHAILRPAVLFGHEGILINNIAWFLRRFPAFGVFGSGDYLMQPVHVEDLADLAVAAGRRDDNVVMDAVGPETYAFEGLVRLVAEKIGARARILHLQPRLAYQFTRAVGYLTKDVVLTWDEVQGLMANLLVSTEVPTGPTLLSRWLEENSARVGRRYASELARHYR